ncbi:MAG TPA: hypothetical protein VJT75_17595, partial [Thermoleophilaceae bacterium]|nr:hypothetical protein [Thermoleophilaceae bacterium]
MTHRRLRPRAAALLTAGSYAVHQLRYVLGYGHHSHDELAGQGHAYMALLAPVLAVALVVLLADLGARLVQARTSRARPGTGSDPARASQAIGFAGAWALATA